MNPEQLLKKALMEEAAAAFTQAANELKALEEAELAVMLVYHIWLELWVEQERN